MPFRFLSLRHISRRRQMAGLLVNDELEGVWKKAVQIISGAIPALG
jgi:hypothetical protein